MGKPEIISITPLEHIIKADGKHSLIIDVSSNTQEGVKTGEQFLKDRFPNSSVTAISQVDAQNLSGGKKTFGFHFGNCQWVPEKDRKKQPSQEHPELN